MIYEDIPDEILDFVRKNHCQECRSGRARCETEDEQSCLSFKDECGRLVEEDEQ